MNTLTTIKLQKLHLILIMFSGLLCACTSSSAGEPADDRIYMGSFTDRDWTDNNPCGDKVTSHSEWDDNEQWFGDTGPYFAKIFPEWFLPDGSPNLYNNWKSEIEKIKAQGRVPYINWEAHGQTKAGECWHGGGPNDRAPRQIITEINEGQHDALIENLAIGLREEKTKIVMDLFHEMNGLWYDWSPCVRDAGWEDWRNAYKRIVNIFRDNNATNVEFGSSVWFANFDTCPTSIEQMVDNIYIPGYMDWIGIDIYGDTSGNSFSALMDPWYNALANTGLPIVVGEMSVSVQNNNFQGKEEWMSEFKDALVNDYPRVKAFNWFDINKDWVNQEPNFELDFGGVGEHFSGLMEDPRFVGAFGSYEIVSKSNGQCLEIEANSNSDSANIAAGACSHTANQIFTLTDLGAYEMEIRALSSDKCLDVAGGSSSNGANIQQYNCNASGAQTWTMNVIDWDTLEVELIAGNSDKCLDLNAAEGNVQQSDCTSSTSQRWNLSKTENGAAPELPASLNGVYEIINEGSNKCLDIASASTATGANVQAYSCNKTPAQQFKIVDLGGDNLLLRPMVNTNLCVDIVDLSQSNGANAYQSTCVGGDNQTWVVSVKNASTMEVSLTAKHSGKCLDEDLASANVQQWDCADTGNQRWRLVNTDPGTVDPQSPFYGSPHTLPGKVLAGDYDLGGQDIAYNDLSDGNSGNAHREDDVDLENSDIGDYNLGWTEAGEWLEYTVNVTESNNYALNVLSASAAGGGSLRFEFSGATSARSASISVGDTGNWQNWVRSGSVSLDLNAGVHVVRMVIESGSFNIHDWTLGSDVSSGLEVIAVSMNIQGHLAIDQLGYADEFAAYMNHHNADVVGIQEGVHDWRLGLPQGTFPPDGNYERAAKVFAELGNCWDRRYQVYINTCKGNRFVYFERFDLTDGENATRTGELAVINKDGQEYTFINLHWDHQSYNVREANTLETLAKANSVSTPLIVLGDFNTGCTRDEGLTDRLAQGANLDLVVDEHIDCLFTRGFSGSGSTFYMSESDHHYAPIGHLYR